MNKYLASIFVLALTFGAIESTTINAGVMNGDETCICIGPRSNGFNATGTRRNGTCARSQTGPFCFTEEVNGDGIMVVTDEQSYTNFCSTMRDPAIEGEAFCPEGKILASLDCETNPQIPQRGTGVPTISVTALSSFANNNDVGAMPTSIQRAQCRLDCNGPEPPGITGTLTAVAYCEQL